MTCIVGLVHQGAVYMGGDSAGLSGYDLVLSDTPKVFRNGEFLIGYTSSFRMGQLLQYRFSPPPINSHDLHAYMCTDFVDAVRECLKAGGFAEKEKDVERGGDFLVGCRGDLFTVYQNYSVLCFPYGYASVGCGESYARGSLYSTRESADPEHRIREALNAAATFSGGVSPPFVVQSINELPEARKLAGALGVEPRALMEGPNGK